MENKKSQISVFFIIGIVIVFFIISLFLIRAQINKKKLESDINTINAFADVRGKVSTYVEGCVEVTTQDLLDKLWITEEEDIPYYLDRYLLECIDEFSFLEEQGYDVEFSDFSSTAEFLNDEIYVELFFPVIILKDEQRAVVEDFNVRIPADIEGGKIFNFNDVQNYEMIFENVVYKTKTMNDPYLQEIYIVKMNLNDKDIRFTVTPPRDNAGVRTNFMKTSDFLASQNAQVAINANGWNRATDQSLMGLAAYHGDIYGSPGSDHSTIFFSKDNEVSFVINGEEKPDPIWNAVSARAVIVEDGINLKIGADKLEPRTTIGLDEYNNIMIFVVVDGRQKGYSAGAGLESMARHQINEGATIAFNADGGGSSTMAIQGKNNEGMENSPVVNSPSDEVEFVQTCPYTGGYDYHTGMKECFNGTDTKPSVEGNAIPFTGEERIVGSHLAVYAKPWN